jgi:hypothetical protein
MSKLFSLSILALSFIPLASGDAVALKKRPEFRDIACTCSCFRDGGHVVKLRSTVKTTIKVENSTGVIQDCSQLDGGGCRYAGISPGTLANCENDKL